MLPCNVDSHTDDVNGVDRHDELDFNNSDLRTVCNLCTVCTLSVLDISVHSMYTDV